MFGYRWFDDIINMVNWIGYLGIQGNVIVFVIDSVGIREEFDVFQDCVMFDGIEDFWFFFVGQVDGFSVVVIFEVEDVIFVLVVFIVINQQLVRVSR